MIMPQKLHTQCDNSVDVSVFFWTAAIETQQTDDSSTLREGCYQSMKECTKGTPLSLCEVSKKLPQGISPFTGSDSTGTPDSV